VTQKTHARISKAPRNTAFDSMLIQVKKERRLVTIYMPFEMEFTDAIGAFKAYIENVDVYAVKVSSAGRGFWISKSFIVGVEE